MIFLLRGKQAVWHTAYQPPLLLEGRIVFQRRSFGDAVSKNMTRRNCMNKKLIAVAVASALGVPAVAWAQASTVQIYGRAYLEYGFIDQGNRSAAQVGGVNAISGALPDVDIFQTPGSAIGV